ncbi:MAG: hypothetical protein ACU0CI_01505 [Shimia sp.]
MFDGEKTRIYTVHHGLDRMGSGPVSGGLEGVLQRGLSPEPDPEAFDRLVARQIADPAEVKG